MADILNNWYDTRVYILYALAFNDLYITECNGKHILPTLV